LQQPSTNNSGDNVICFKENKDSSRTCIQRADLFSLGVVTYECLSGKNPFSEGATSHIDIPQRTETVTPVTFRLPVTHSNNLWDYLAH